MMTTKPVMTVMMAINSTLINVAYKYPSVSLVTIAPSTDTWTTTANGFKNGYLAARSYVKNVILDTISIIKTNATFYLQTVMWQIQMGNVLPAKRTLELMLMGYVKKFLFRCLKIIVQNMVMSMAKIKSGVSSFKGVRQCA